MLKKKDSYYPSDDQKKKAWINSGSIYRQNPQDFWKELSKEVQWQKKPRKGFNHKPPYFSWFEDGQLNITESCLDRHLVDKKNKVAFIFEPENPEESRRVFTYNDLYREVNKFANGLKKVGVKKGDRVGIYLPMIPEVIIAMLACARIGAVHAVVFSAFSSASLKVRLQDTQAKVLITADGYNRRGKVIDLKTSADQGIEGTKVEKVVLVKHGGNEVEMTRKHVWWNDILGEDECKAVTMKSEDPLFILYTSGSTGKPKGILHACGGYTVQAQFTAKWVFDLHNNDVFWSTADVGWVTGHTYSVYGPLLNGATFVIYEGAPDYPEANRWCEIIKKYGVTIFYTAPTAIRMFQKMGVSDNFPTLRLLGSVGEPIDEKTWKWFFEKVGGGRCPIVDTWWQTETGGVLISSLPGVGPFRPSHVGRPFPGVNFDILDEKGKKVKKGEKGDLVILPPFPPGLLRGVYKDPKKYKSTYWSEFGDKIYFTSDTAYRDGDIIRVAGRSDDVIKVAGHRLSTGELENVISKVPGVTECAVIGIFDEIKGEVPLVFAVLKKDTGDISQDIVLKIRQDIGPIYKPANIHFVQDLPKTRSGKIMRRILKKLITKEELGDLSTLANPESVDQLRKIL
jgi:acetyl-CoA synthetase